MKHTITCKKCNGTGQLKLAPTLELVLGLLYRNGPGGPWKKLTELRGYLHYQTTSARLSAKLAKLVRHGLAERVQHADGTLFWRAK